jgi:hypothetical protein
MLSLPKERSEASTHLEDYITLLYGPKKIGKTTFASQFPDAFFMMFEPGSKALEIYSRPMKKWADFKAYVDLLTVDKRFKNVVIDTADLCYLFCERFTCAKLGVEDIADAGYGKGWRSSKIEFILTINKLVNAGKGIIFLSHSSEREVELADGSEIMRVTSTMSKQAAEVLEALVDIWVYYRYTKTGGREFVIRGTQKIDAGTRTKKNFLGISRIPAGNNEEEAYENFVAAFENRLTTEPKAVKFKIK